MSPISSEVEPIDDEALSSTNIESPQIATIPSPVEAIPHHRPRRQTRRPGYLDAYEC